MKTGFEARYIKLCASATLQKYFCERRFPTTFMAITSAEGSRSRSHQKPGVQAKAQTPYRVRTVMIDPFRKLW